MRDRACVSADALAAGSRSSPPAVDARRSPRSRCREDTLLLATPPLAESQVERGEDGVAEEVRRQHAAHQRGRQGEEAESRQAEAPERHEQEEEDSDEGGNAEADQAALRGLSLLELSQKLRVVLEWEVDLLDRAL